MLEQTDMGKVKEIAIGMLYYDIDESEYSPFIVSHPFTTCGIWLDTDHDCRMTNLLEDDEGMQLWRDKVRAAIDECGTVKQIAFLVSKGWSMEFLFQVMPYLSIADFSELLADTWVSVEGVSYCGYDSSVFIDLFQMADKKHLMNSDDYKIYSELDDMLLIFRGVCDRNQIRPLKREGMSWTLSYDTAEFFKNRFQSKDRPTGAIIKAYIKKENILAYFNTRNEHEVVVDPRYLINA